MVPTPEELKNENRKIRTLRILTDLTLQRLCVEEMTISEARDAVRQLKRAATGMFPGKGEVFDMVVAPRLERVIDERFGKEVLQVN